MLSSSLEFTNCGVDLMDEQGLVSLPGPSHLQMLPGPTKPRLSLPSSWTFWERAPRGMPTLAPGSREAFCCQDRRGRGRLFWPGRWQPRRASHSFRARPATSWKCSLDEEVRRVSAAAQARACREAWRKGVKVVEPDIWMMVEAGGGVSLLNVMGVFVLAFPTCLCI